MKGIRGRGVHQAVAGLSSEEDVMKAIARVALSLLAMAAALCILAAPSLVAATEPTTGAVSGAAAAAVDEGSPSGAITVRVGNISIEQSECYTVPDGATTTEDAYLFSGSIWINGTLDGDVCAFTREADINGVVTQDVNVFAETVRVKGEIGDDLRVGCKELIIDGHVRGDVIVGAAELHISESAVIDGDLLAGAGLVTIDGHIGGRALIRTGVLTLNGTIAGNADIGTDGGITLGPDAHIGGDLAYEGPCEPDLASGAVAGQVIFTLLQDEDEDIKFTLGSIFGPVKGLLHLLELLMALVAGTVIVALTKDHARRTAEIIRTKPMKSLGIGFVTYICLPIVLVLLLVFVITIPLMLVVLLAYLIALYIAKFYFAIWLGNLILRRSGRTDVSPIPGMLLGLVIVYLVTAIPVAGTLAGIVIIFFGIGALLQRKETRLNGAFEVQPVAADTGALPNAFPGSTTGA